MSILLFEHNQTAYDKALELLMETGKAAVIHPTGTGKSFIAFKLCEQFPEKKVLWLSPSDYIFRTQLDNLKKASNGWVPQNVRFFTYARLMMMTQEDLEKLCPDYIILDEFHRCGAEMWGKGVSRLLALYSSIPVLGLSATAIRYLDNQRNMADELFDGNIASEMTLGEAIVRGILNPPKYVLSVFSYADDYKKLKIRVQGAKSKATRDKAEKYLEGLRRALEKADGLDKIFEKHMTERTGKYIVFCSNMKHLREMREKIGAWVKSIDAQPHVYTAYSEDSAAQAQYFAFKSDNSEHLKLLFCIDMLNEGIHVENVNGVILFRPTVSPIIYKQQIGRALEAGKCGTPVIWDIVNNIENLYSIGTIEQEMRVAISYYRSLGQSEYIVNERFEVVDEVREAKELFELLNDTLTASWDTMYEHARAYYRAYGNLDVPKSYKTPQGYSLGTWVMTQRRVYAGAVNGNLTEERIHKLEQIGMTWESKTDVSWKRHFAAARAYFEEHGDLKVPASFVSSDGVRLGMWLVNLKTYRKNGSHQTYLSEDRIRRLDEIGMIWNGYDFLWQRNLAEAARYFQKHGDLCVPPGYVTENGVKLYDWIVRVRMSYRSIKQGETPAVKLTEQQIEELTAIGMDWRTYSQIKWETAYALAEEYFKTYGNLNVPLRYKTDSGFSLGIWVNNQRKRLQKGELSAECTQLLNALQMKWEKPVKAYTWNDMFSLAQQYYLEHGHLRIPTDYQINGVWITRWINEQRSKRRSCGKSRLSEEQIEKLDSIGMEWGSRSANAWHHQFEEAKAYFNENGDLNIPPEFVSPSGKKTRNWIERQKTNYRKGLLTQEQIHLLHTIGWQIYEKDN